MALMTRESWMIIPFSVTRLTDTVWTPFSDLMTFSIVPTHEAHVMPPMLNSVSKIGVVMDSCCNEVTAFEVNTLAVNPAFEVQNVDQFHFIKRS